MRDCRLAPLPVRRQTCEEPRFHDLLAPLDSPTVVFWQKTYRGQVREREMIGCARGIMVSQNQPNQAHKLEQLHLPDLVLHRLLPPLNFAK